MGLSVQKAGDAFWLLFADCPSSLPEPPTQESATWGVDACAAEESPPLHLWGFCDEFGDVIDEAS